MAISGNIDFAAIAQEMRQTVARWYNATIEIIDPNIREQEWNMATNSWGTSSETLIYSGGARVQPIRSTSEPDLGITQGAIRSVRIQVPYDATVPLIQKGFQVRVTSGGENHVLEDLKLVVRSAINSSYGWNTTIECDADVKSVDNGS